MFSVRSSKTVKPTRHARGHFLFELVISAMMITAIAVLAFPTYQDFAPEPGIDGQVLPAVAGTELADPANSGETGMDGDPGAEPVAGDTRPGENADSTEDAGEV